MSLSRAVITAALIIGGGFLTSAAFCGLMIWEAARREARRAITQTVTRTTRGPAPVVRQRSDGAS